MGHNQSPPCVTHNTPAKEWVVGQDLSFSTLNGFGRIVTEDTPDLSQHAWPNGKYKTWGPIPFFLTLANMSPDTIRTIPFEVFAVDRIRVTVKGIAPPTRTLVQVETRAAAAPELDTGDLIHILPGRLPIKSSTLPGLDTVTAGVFAVDALETVAWTAATRTGTGVEKATQTFDAIVTDVFTPVPVWDVIEDPTGFPRFEWDPPELEGFGNWGVEGTTAEASGTARTVSAHDAFTVTVAHPRHGFVVVKDIAHPSQSPTTYSIGFTAEGGPTTRSDALAYFTALDRTQSTGATARIPVYVMLQIDIPPAFFTAACADATIRTVTPFENDGGAYSLVTQTKTSIRNVVLSVHVEYVLRNALE